MATATFDTLHAAKALTAAGFEAQQAEAITDTIREAFTQSVATKADIAGLEAAVKADIAGLEAAVAVDIAEVKTEIADLRTEVKADIAGIYKQLWLVALGIVTAIAAIVKLL